MKTELANAKPLNHEGNFAAKVAAIASQLRPGATLDTPIPVKTDTNSIFFFTKLDAVSSNRDFITFYGAGSPDPEHGQSMKVQMDFDMSTQTRLGHPNFTNL